MASLIKNLFRENAAKNLVTLFHKPSNPTSMRALSIAKQFAAAQSVTATEGQASSQGAQNTSDKVEFDFEVSEAPPTVDQLRTLMDYVGGPAAKLVPGANDQHDALKRLSEDGDAFQRPVLVSWHGGKAVAGDNESEILSLLRSVPKGP